MACASNWGLRIRPGNNWRERFAREHNSARREVAAGDQANVPAD
jgi:hypothetical protein